MERMTGARENLHLDALQYSMDAAKAFGFQLEDGLVDRLTSEYQGGRRESEEEAVASAILRAGLVHRAAGQLQELPAGGYYEPQYHLHVLVSATKGALDGLALWLNLRRNLRVDETQCDFTKESFRQRLAVSFPKKVRGLVLRWLEDVRRYSIWLEHRGTMPIIPLVDPATRRPKGYEVLVDRVTVTRKPSKNDADDDRGENPEDLNMMALDWSKRLADFVSAGIGYGMGDD